jgi:hypothetical protein
LRERLNNIIALDGLKQETVRARVLGFLRFYDVCHYYTRLFVGQKYKPLYNRLRLA